MSNTTTSSVHGTQAISRALSVLNVVRQGCSDLGAIERAIKTALTILTEARTAISILPGSIYLEAMQSVAGYLEGLLQSCRQ